MVDIFVAVNYIIKRNKVFKIKLFLNIEKYIYYLEYK